MSKKFKIGQVVFLVVVSAQLLSRPAFAEIIYATSINTNQVFSVDTVAHTATPIFTAPSALDSLVFDSTGRIIYTELDTGVVAAYNPITHTNVTLASSLMAPIDLALEPSNTSVLVSVAASNLLSRVSLAGAGVTGGLVVGGRPDGLIYDAAGDLFVNVSSGFQSNNSQVERIDPATGAVLATSGNTGLFLDGLTYDSSTGKLFATDYNNGRIVRIDPSTLAVTVLPGVTVPSNGPDGITSDGMGNLFLASRANGQVVEYNILSNTATNIAFIDGLDDLAPASGLGSPVPEPSSWVLLGVGLLSLAGFVKASAFSRGCRIANAGHINHNGDRKMSPFC
jgi:sugar lactone lactonase YvrE